MSKTKRSQVVKYNKWGYIFLIPFVVVYLMFQFVPLVTTIYYSFYERYLDTMTFSYVEGFAGLKNYKTLFTDPNTWKYLQNTLILWVIGFIPQILVSLLLGAWFSDNRLKLKAAGFFKVVIYLPNLIMATAFSMLFFMLFSNSGSMNAVLLNMGVIDKGIHWLDSIWLTRFLIGFMNFLLWFGNTTILLMAGMMGIDTSLFEAAEVDGANSSQKFFKITLPLLRPILLYVMITSLVGGLQMFDVPQILTKTTGGTNRTSMTLIMFLNRYVSGSRDYGNSGALSVFLFAITAVLSVIIFKVSGNSDKVK